MSSMLLRLALALVSVGLLATSSQADSIIPSTALELRDEGSSQGNIKKIDCVGTGVSCARSGVVGTITVSGGGSGYATIQDEGTPLTQRATVNFIGASITCVDNAGATKTDCTISGGGTGLDHAAVMSRTSLGF